ncbi:S-adenosyl-L-methionine-dependent methyltransferase, partial [Cylindrobasidium torrendii FP15055 ss-10]
PTTFLPPLGRLSSLPVEALIHALDTLSAYYWPLPLPNKTDHAIHDVSVPDSGYASAEEEEEVDSDSDNEEGREDPFERAHAFRWLTTLLARADDPIVLELAGVLLERLAATPDSQPTECAVTRVFNFSNGVKVEMNDEPVTATDHTSVGLQSWASSIHLSERMCADPETYNLRGRILELGAGTGLVSIAAAKISNAELIVATDFHPDVLANLQVNVDANKCDVQVEKLDWAAPPYGDTPFDAPFDVILAADCIYHVDHARWIRGVVEKLLAKDGTFWMMFALRSIGRHEGLADIVDEVFNANATDGLVVHQRLDVQRTQGIGRPDEGGYRLLQIRW